MLMFEFLVAKPLKCAVLCTLCFIAAGCGQSGDTPDADASVVTINGTAMKGVISQGIARAYRIEQFEGKYRARRTVGAAVRTDDQGKFELQVPASEDLDALMIEVSSDAQTEMTCDDISGCLSDGLGESVSFGERFGLGDNFSLKAVLPRLDRTRAQSLSVTPLSHLVAARAEGSAEGLSATSIESSTQFIETMMGLASGDLELEPVDITRLDTYTNLEKGRLAVSLLSAAFLNQVDGVDFTGIAQVLASAATKIAETGTLASTSNNTGENAEENTVALDALNLHASQQASELAASSNDPEQQAILNDINVETETAYQEHAAPVTPVDISLQPQSMSILAGETALFSVEATGGGNLRYQWRYNGSPLLSETGSRLVIDNVQSAAQGIYDVLVSNSAGAQVSLGALLEIDEEEVVNSVPQANDDTATVQEDGTVQVNVLANDTDADGDTLVVTSAQTDVGTVVVNSNQSLSYQTEPNQSGMVDVLYTVSDGRGGFASATLRVNVSATNDAPNAVNDVASTLEDQAVTINVLANDSDADGDSLSVSQASATNGVVIINSNNTLSFVPADNVFGSALISYSISDGEGGSASAQVAVSIAAANDNPVARNDSATTTEDQAVTVNVLANDSDVDGDSLSLAAVSAASGSAAIVDGTRLRFTPAANFTGAVEVSYTLSDGQGGSDTASVTINVGEGNDAPVAVNDVASLEEDTSLTIDVLANDSDVDGDALVISSVTADQGSASITAGQEILYTPDADFNGAVSLTYTISDGQGGSASAAVSLTVNAVNDAPVGNDDVASTPEDTAVTVNVLANDTDVDGDTLTLSSVSASEGSALLDSSNRLVYTPDNNFYGDVTIDYTFHDNQGEQGTAQVTLTVIAQNDLPVAQNDSASTAEDTAVSINVLSNDSDVDGDTLVVSQASATHGSVTIAGNQAVLYSPEANYFGSDTLSYTVSDGQGGSVVATVAISVSAVNDDPVAVADTAATDAEIAVSINALANDSDVDGDSLSISSAAASSGSVSVNAQGVVTYTPGAGFDGVDTIFYSLNDGQGGSSTGSIAVTVNALETTASVDLSWDIPTEREDGSALELYEIDGYVIAYGTASGNLTETLSITGGGETDATIADLPAGTWYFAIATIDSDGVQGAFSGEIQQTIL